jgi:hypothetical protein
MKRSIKMKKTIIFMFALSLFALPMSLHANPPAKADAAKSTLEPLSAMKSTMTSPSETPAIATEAEGTAKSTKKAMEEKATDTAKKMVEDAGNDGAKKAIGQ